MPMLETSIAAVSDHIPKVISQETHAIADYLTVGGFFAMAALLWRKNHRAAFAALVCGTGLGAQALLTNYPGGVGKLFRYSTHLKADLGAGPLVSALPSLLGFGDEPEAKWFRVQGLQMTGMAAMSRPEPKLQRAKLRRIA